jgi:integrase
MQDQPKCASTAPLVKVAGSPGVYRKGNRYVVVWRHRGQQRKKSFRTLEEARRFKGSATAGDTAPVSRERFDVHARAWLDSYQGRSRRGRPVSTTLDTYRHAIERHAIPYFKGMRLAEIGPPDVRAWLDVMRKQGLKAATVRTYLAPVRAMFAEAVEDGTLKSNPALVRVTGDAERTRGPKMLTPDEIRRLRACVPDEWLDLFDFIAYTGCRISEALGGTWKRITIDADGRPVFEVREQFYKGELRAHAKTAAGSRAVPLAPDIARRLRARRLRSPHSLDDDPVFATIRGTHIDASNWRNNVWNPARAAAGLDWATTHTLRHSLASILLDNGHTIEQIAAWLGHEDSAFTLRTYVHSRDAGSADFLDGVLGASANG